MPGANGGIRGSAVNGTRHAQPVLALLRKVGYDRMTMDAVATRTRVGKAQGQPAGEQYLVQVVDEVLLPVLMHQSQ
jgi:hypothetical protein